MSAVTPIRSLTEKYAEMSADDIGRLGSKGYGKRKFDEFSADFRELVRLAKIGERVQSEGRFR